ncbi:hypothetical protein SAMD00019534_005390 [Acytostelium subglobosum LB1]|uniref:hypothetical protein n=1 Tax=Acytostelium subglobosum LB1 TaxID=1410327 RepID=UPI000644A2E2|nr:hypothetical protein SAMD00019534_005390 [Acytostelium subglobosum LB1]GAM17364.1 hypothetical protein SAMD00019534_005390 [Acytostelium subglobosum LB1]|eukprot:XP_012759426.1 hypothetical protein SAMD00019534_005390 [Acytostelium subglobosum LB1]
MDNEIKYLSSSLVDVDDIGIDVYIQQQQQLQNEQQDNNKTSDDKSQIDPQKIVDTFIKTLVDVFKDCIERIDNGTAKDAIDLFQPYIDQQQFTMLRDMSTKICGDAAAQLDGNEMQIAALDSYLRPVGAAARFTPLRAANKTKQGAPTNAVSGNKAASYQSSSPQAGAMGGAAPARRSRETKEGFPLNWGSIIAMAANINLDQIKSMMNVLIMILTHTPIPVILRELHRFRMITSVFFDLVYAIYRGDIPVSVTKYIHSFGNKKRFGFLRLTTLILYLSYLYKIINPPPMTPSDLIQFCKAYLASKL